MHCTLRATSLSCTLYIFSVRAAAPVGSLGDEGQYIGSWERQCVARTDITDADIMALHANLGSLVVTGGDYDMSELLGDYLAVRETVYGYCGALRGPPATGGV